MNYRSNSPGDGTNCASSAPPSPVSQSLSPASSPGLAASPASPFTDQMTTMNCQNQVVLIFHSFLDAVKYLTTFGLFLKMGSGSGGNLNQMSFYPNQSNVLNQFEQFNMVSLIMFDEVLSAGEGGMLHLSFLFQCDIISKLKHDY
jgi:hypothetical protein